MTDSLLHGIAGFCVCLLLVPAAMRIRNGLGPITRLFALALAVHLCSCVVSALSLAEWNYWYGGALYWCLFMVFLDVFGTVYTSVSIMMLVNISRLPGRSASLELLHSQGGEKSLLERIEGLTESGYARRIDERYALTEKGRRIGRFLLAAHAFFNIQGSGMYSWGDGSAGALNSQTRKN